MFLAAGRVVVKKHRFQYWNAGWVLHNQDI